MKKSLFLLACIGLMLSLNACGDDEPNFDRDKSTIKLKALTHVLDKNTNEAVMTVDASDTYSIYLKQNKADMELTIPIDGSDQTFNITNVPISPVANADYCYNVNQAQTSNASVTNLKGYINLSEYLVIMQCDVNGHHVCINIPEVFFDQTSLTFNYSDGSQSSCNNGSWITQVAGNAQKADLIINEIEIAKDFREKEGEFIREGNTLYQIKVEDAAVEYTASGCRITADQPKATTLIKKESEKYVEIIYKHNGTDYPYYIIRNLVNEVNLVTGTMTASFDVRHVLEYSKQGANAGEPTRWDDIHVTATGKTFKNSLFN